MFNLFEDFLTDRHGDDAYEELLAACPQQAKEPFVGPAPYQDAAFTALCTKAAEKLSTPLPELLRAFGRYAMPRLAVKFPLFVWEHKHPKSFLKGIDSTIHAELTKFYVHAKPPAIAVRDTAPDRLVLEYRSARRLCALLVGLIEGTADYFKVPIHCTHGRCVQDGAEWCELELFFGAAPSTPT